MPIEKVISGAQTGADQGGLDFAIDHRIAHGGECPKGRRSDNGRIHDRYHLTENQSWRYDKRTEVNVRNSDATVIFQWNPKSPGSVLTANLCWAFGKPCLSITTRDVSAAENEFRRWVSVTSIKILNVAGNRERTAPGINQFVKDVLTRCQDLF